jgi:hypothetical protein
VIKEYRPRLNEKENQFLQEHRRKKVNRLIVGDIHLPYTHPRYLQHCIEIYKKHDCNAVSMTGDIIDSHFASFHSINTETHGAKYELDMAIKETAKWYEAFNNDTVPNGITITLGNHDLIIARKSEEAGIDNRWVRKLNEVLKCPDWIFEEQFLHDNVLYAHGNWMQWKRNNEESPELGTFNGPGPHSHPSICRFYGFTYRFEVGNASTLWHRL